MTSDTPGPASLEGRLLAQRATLARIIALLPDAPRTAMLAWLDDRSILRDGQEDPGAVPDPAAATALAEADEFRLLRQFAAPARPAVAEDAPPQPM